MLLNTMRGDPTLDCCHTANAIAVAQSIRTIIINFFQTHITALISHLPDRFFARRSSKERDCSAEIQLFILED